MGNFARADVLNVNDSVERDSGPFVGQELACDQSNNHLDKGFKAISHQLSEKGILPAIDESDVPSTLGRAATALNHQNLGVPADLGRSSGTSASLLLKASGADIKPTMDIGNLHGQLVDGGWQSSEYKPGDPLRPGDLLFTSLIREGRNVGIVGDDGAIYTHNATTKQFEGRQNWSSKFNTVMRVPEEATSR